jgi:hypothetical protein
MQRELLFMLLGAVVGAAIALAGFVCGYRAAIRAAASKDIGRLRAELSEIRRLRAELPADRMYIKSDGKLGVHPLPECRIFD